jgi:hypothetical protein
MTTAYAAIRMLALFRYSVDVPFGDQWNFATLLRTTKNTISWSDLWAPHNEHRIVVPNLLMIALARFTHWNIRAEIAVVHALIGLRFAIVLGAIYQIGRKAKLNAWTCVPLIAGFLLTRAQAENLMWGWQITIALGALLTLLSCLVLANSGWPRFLLAILLTIASQLSFASGVVLWPVGAIFIALQLKLSARTKIVRVLLWLTTGSILTFLYNRGLPRATETMPVSASRMLRYSVMFIGSAITPMRAAPAEELAWQIGVVGLGLFALGIVGVTATRQFTRWTPIIMWGLTAPATAVVIAYGRLGFVPNSQAMSSRYVTLSVSIWAASSAMLTATVLHLFRNRSKRVVGIFGAVLVSFACVGIVTVAGPWEKWSKDRGADSLRNRAFLSDDALMTPENKALLLADPKLIDEERQFLIAERLTQFRTHVPATTVLPVPTTVLEPTSTTSPIPTTAPATTLPGTTLPETRLPKTTLPKTTLPKTTLRQTTEVPTSASPTTLPAGTTVALFGQ